VLGCMCCEFLTPRICYTAGPNEPAKPTLCGAGNARKRSSKNSRSASTAAAAVGAHRVDDVFGAARKCQRVRGVRRMRLCGAHIGDEHRLAVAADGVLHSQGNRIGQMLRRYSQMSDMGCATREPAKVELERAPATRISSEALAQCNSPLLILKECVVPKHCPTLSRCVSLESR